MAVLTALSVSILCLTTAMVTHAVPNGQVQCHAGSVHCDADHVYSTSDTSFHCGQQPEGQCLRHLWSGHLADSKGEVGFTPPRVPGAGWTVCVTGVPTQFTRISIDFLGNEDRAVVSHFDIRMSGNHGPSFDQSVVINEAERGWDEQWEWGHQEVFHPQPYPFAVGQEFTVRIVAAAEHNLVYFANGKQVATREIQRSVRDVSKVIVTGDVTISQVNLWCQ